MRVLNTKIERDYFYGDTYYHIWYEVDKVVVKITFHKPFNKGWFPTCGGYRECGYLTARNLIAKGKELAMRARKEYERWYK